MANLYFVVLDLAMIEPTYQWSLEFYIILFERSIRYYRIYTYKPNIERQSQAKRTDPVTS